jgi:site-specific DNA-methyltransferase (cytosine-N4-specific)
MISLKSGLNLKSSFLINGDSTEVLRYLPSNSIQCAVTSPPYWGQRDYRTKGQIGLEDCVDVFLESLVAVFSEVKRILKDTGVLWIVMGDGYTSGNRKYRATYRKYPERKMRKRPDTPEGLKKKDLIGTPWKLAFALQSDGWYLRSETIWHKPNAMPESVEDRPWRNHEHIFLLS